MLFFLKLIPDPVPMITRSSSWYSCWNILYGKWMQLKVSHISGNRLNLILIYRYRVMIIRQANCVFFFLKDLSLDGNIVSFMPWIQGLHEAVFWKDCGENRIQCLLCPHHCRLLKGEEGKCHVRLNEGGRLMTKTYGIVSSLHLDPVEKKPLYHFYPGKSILSLGSYGCNLHCIFCQNWEISQCIPENPEKLKHLSPEEVIMIAKSIPGNMGIAFTYNEPVVNLEYIMDIARRAKEDGMVTAMITNGFIASKPLQQVLPLMDAFNVDLKVFSGSLYKRFTGGSLQPVLRALKAIHRAGRHLEVTHLVVPGINNDPELFDQLTGWIVGELGEQTVLHVSRYFPQYRMKSPATPSGWIERFCQKAHERLSYTYTGNIHHPGGSVTYCHRCGSKLISRCNYHTSIEGLSAEGSCLSCGAAIIRWI